MGNQSRLEGDKSSFESVQWNFGHLGARFYLIFTQNQCGGWGKGNITLAEFGLENCPKSKIFHLKIVLWKNVLQIFKIGEKYPLGPPSYSGNLKTKNEELEILVKIKDFRSLSVRAPPLTQGSLNYCVCLCSSLFVWYYLLQ